MPRVKKKLPWWVSFMRYFGRSVVILWAILLLLFAAIEALEASNVLVFIIPAVIIIASAVIPWIWEGVGAFVLLGEAAAFFVFFMIISQGRMGAVVLLVFCLPPLVGGGLSLASWLVARKAPPKQA